MQLFCPQILEDSGVELSPARDGRRGGRRGGGGVEGDSAGIGVSPSNGRRRESRRRRGEGASPNTPIPKSNSPTAPKKQRYSERQLREAEVFPLILCLRLALEL